jgi:EAL domain-containing protein (putative c-di-GMP-specific phosphodiesterase class I)
MYAVLPVRPVRGDDGPLRMPITTLPRAVPDGPEIEEHLPKAIAGREIRVHFQAQYDVKSGRGCGVEALARWIGPKGGEVPPTVFIPVAERLQLIGELGRSVLQQSCEIVTKWEFSPPDQPSLSVNVSSQQINEGFCDVVAHILRTTGLPGERLELEVTESSLIGDFEYVVECLLRWKALGVRIAIDDFGTGYSNLNYIARLPVDRLKLDMSFVHRMLHDRKTAAIVRSVFALGREIGITVLAEGVESEKQLGALERLGCRQVQGYLFARPAPAGEARALLASVWGDRWKANFSCPHTHMRDLYAS